jgi:hypothetical protein
MGAKSRNRAVTETVTLFPLQTLHTLLWKGRKDRKHLLLWMEE